MISRNFLLSMDMTKHEDCIQKFLADGNLSNDCYRELNRLAVRFIRAQASTLSPDQMGILAHEAIKKAWETRAKCLGATTFWGWFRTITRGCVLQYLRKQKQQGLRSQPLLHNDDEGVERNYPAPDDTEAQVVNEATANLINQGLTEKFSKKEWQVYLLRREDVPFVDIGTQLGISENAAKQTMQRIKPKAIKLLEALGSLDTQPKKNTEE